MYSNYFAQGGQPQPQQDPQAQLQQILQQVEQMLQQGANPQQVMQQLVQSGIPQQQAQQVIQQAMQEMQQPQEQQEQQQPQAQQMQQEQSEPQGQMKLGGMPYNLHMYNNIMDRVYARGGNYPTQEQNSRYLAQDDFRQAAQLAQQRMQFAQKVMPNVAFNYAKQNLMNTPQVRRLVNPASIVANQTFDDGGTTGLNLNPQTPGINFSNSIGLQPNLGISNEIPASLQPNVPAYYPTVYPTSPSINEVSTRYTPSRYGDVQPQGAKKFSDAFAIARQNATNNGPKNFEFNGKIYNTDLRTSHGQATAAKLISKTMAQSNKEYGDIADQRMSYYDGLKKAEPHPSHVQADSENSWFQGNPNAIAPKSNFGLKPGPQPTPNTSTTNKDSDWNPWSVVGLTGVAAVGAGATYGMVKGEQAMNKLYTTPGGKQYARHEIELMRTYPDLAKKAGFTAQDINATKSIMLPENKALSMYRRLPNMPEMPNINMKLNNPLSGYMTPKEAMQYAGQQLGKISVKNPLSGIKVPNMPEVRIPSIKINNPLNNYMTPKQAMQYAQEQMGKIPTKVGGKLYEFNAMRPAVNVADKIYGRIGKGLTKIGKRFGE